MADVSVRSGNAARPAAGVQQSGLGSRLNVFLYDLAVLFLLVLLAAFYVANRAAFTPWSAVQLPIEGMWFGALGGVMISLKGVYDHAGPGDWDNQFGLWHFGRPFTGAIAGAITSLLLFVVNGSDPAKAPSAPVVYIAAFIFGTQERRFFEILSQAAQLFVRDSEDKATGLSLQGINPSTAAPGSIVIVNGNGIDPAATVKLGGVLLTKTTVGPDGTMIAGVVPDRPMGADVVDAVVTNPGGASFTLPGKFTFS